MGQSDQHDARREYRRAGPEPSGAGFANTRCAPLLVDGVLYITEPNTVLAIDARNGREIWKYTWRGLPAFALGNRGVGIYGDWLFFETYDNHLVSLDIKTGKERWNKATGGREARLLLLGVAAVIKNHVIVGRRRRFPGCSELRGSARSRDGRRAMAFLDDRA